jgi:glutamate--cysteine ligase
LSDTLQKSIAEIEQSGAARYLSKIQRGMEKESLRVGPDGIISQLPHPRTLGAALHHPHITTDYSESLLEFITPVHDDIDSMLDFLTRLHIFTYQNIGEEILWTNSMPCILQGDESIPIADYGTSNIGFMKHVYRRGLGHRYGRLMQSIAGIHYNFSLPDVFFEAWTGDSSQDHRSDMYFRLIRNFHRYCWILLYLYGAAPAVCQTFLSGRKHNLDVFEDHSFCLNDGTTLRMSDLGYQNSAQDNIQVCTNSLKDYVNTLRAATEQSFPGYEEIGVEVDGEYRQLNTNLLQIENEFYTVIRPKRVIQPMEKPSAALEERGVEYIEVRLMDLNPYMPVGIDKPTIQFLDAFLLFCMFSDSPEISPEEEEEIAHNRSQTVTHGRSGQSEILLNGEKHPFREIATDLLEQINKTAKLLDTNGGTEHQDQVKTELEKITAPEKTPSAVILAEMRETGESYYAFAMRHAKSHEKLFKQAELPKPVYKEMHDVAEQSLQQFDAGQNVSQQPFGEFLRDYFKA